MKLYLASSLSPESRPNMYRALEILRNLGHEVYAPVEHFIDDAWSYSNREWGRLVFEADISAINDSEAVVALSNGRTGTTAGSSWEIGYSYGIRKKVVVVELDEGIQSLMVSNGCHATVKGMEGLANYDFDSMPQSITESEQK